VRWLSIQTRMPIGRLALTRRVPSAATAATTRPSCGERPEQPSLTVPNLGVGTTTIGVRRLTGFRGVGCTDSWRPPCPPLPEPSSGPRPKPDTSDPGSDRTRRRPQFGSAGLDSRLHLRVPHQEKRSTVTWSSCPTRFRRPIVARRSRPGRGPKAWRARHRPGRCRARHRPGLMAQHCEVAGRSDLGEEVVGKDHQQAPHAFSIGQEIDALSVGRAVDDEHASSGLIFTPGRAGHWGLRVPSSAAITTWSRTSRTVSTMGGYPWRTALATSSDRQMTARSPVRAPPTQGSDG
jgi:hypothetical protein